MSLGDWKSRIDRVVLYRNGALITRSGVLDAAGADGWLRLATLPSRSDVRSIQVRVLGSSTLRAVRLQLRTGSDGSRVACAFIQSEAASSSEGVMLELDYFVPGPRWAPGYALRVDSTMEHCELSWHAMVAQATGEDWEDVRLSLATASYVMPTRRTRLHTQADWRAGAPRDPMLFGDYDRYHGEPPRLEAGRRPSDDSSLPAVSYDSLSAQSTDAASPALAQLDYDRLRLPPPGDPFRGALWAEGELEDELTRSSESLLEALREPLPAGYRRARGLEGADFIYTGDALASLPSDGCFHALPIGQFPVETRATYVIVPRESSEAFRRLEIRNPGQRAIVAGPVDVYFDGEYALSTSLAQVLPSERATVDLGTEPRFDVRREASSTEESAGLLRAGREVTHSVRIHVQSHLDRRARIEVRESIPVPRRGAEDVKVTILEVHPPWGRFAPNRPEQPGRYRWREQLDPGMKITLLVEYLVRMSGRQAALRESQ